MYIAKEQNRWDEYLSQIVMAYRSSKQSSTGQIPNMLTLPLQVVVESPKEIMEAADVNEYGQYMQTRMHLAHEIEKIINFVGDNVRDLPFWRHFMIYTGPCGWVMQPYW
jgi:hypothetical protein